MAVRNLYQSMMIKAIYFNLMMNVMKVMILCQMNKMMLKELEELKVCNKLIKI